MYKYLTSLANYRFNTVHHLGSKSIEWFALSKDENGDEESRPFTYEELTAFKDFITRHPENFPGDKQYSPASEVECPSFDEYSDLPVKNGIHPETVVLRQNPKLNTIGNVPSVADIILNSPNGNNNHHYNLPFAAIGQIK